MNERDHDEIEAIIAAEVERRRAIPTTAFLRICERIEPERELARGPRLEQPLAERWKALTRPLKLAGAPAMHQSVAGRFPVLDAVAEAMRWAGQLIEEIARQLRIQLALGRPWIRIEPLLLVGAPGVGKTWLARRLAQALQVEFAGLELGNASDDRTLSGTARGWTSAQPAWPLVVMASGRTANPMLLLDEVDKAGGSGRNGHPHRALLAMTEPLSARTWFDQCLLAACDLSQVNWIACANSVDPLSAALRSRFRLVAMPPPEPEHFDAILLSVAADLAAGWDVPAASLPELPRRARLLLRERFARNPSVRALARDTRALVGAMLADGGGPRRH